LAVYGNDEYFDAALTPANTITPTTEIEMNDMSKPKENWDRLNTDISYGGRAITLPGRPDLLEDMPKEKAIEALQRKIADENQAYGVHEVFDAHPLDALVAVVKAMQQLYGWASPVPTPSFFGPKPPQMITVKTGVGPDDVIQCPYGKFKLPGVDNPIQTSVDRGPKGQIVLVIAAEVKKKDRHIVLELASKAREILKHESIYRGKAIRINVDSDGELKWNEPPEFIDVSRSDPLIFDDDISSMIHDNVLVHIKHTQEVKKHGVPVRRHVLFAGTYGTGKSLAGRRIGGECVANGWTYILLSRAHGLKAALELAQRWSPAVVFCEDIDRVMEERNESANDLINTMSGVLSAKSEVMVVLTTNFPEKIDKAALRPGRLDAIITLRAPSDQAVQRLLRVYAGELLDADADLTLAGKELSGQIPATIRECVDRAKLGMIGRQDTKLSDQDLVVAARTMKNHLELLNGEVKKPSAGEKLAEALHDAVFNGRGKHIDLLPGIGRTVDRIYQNQ
jgi:SpoVK/Ycf46/Vps4 family AAA+-type ATPase